MMGEVTPCFQIASQCFQIYEALEDLMPSSGPGVSSGSDVHAKNLLYNLSILREKVQQMQSLVALVVSPEAALQPEPMSVPVSTAGSLVQDIIVAASSLMYAFQQAAAVGGTAPLSTAMIDGQSAFPDHGHHVKASSREALQYVLAGGSLYDSKNSVTSAVNDADSGRSIKKDGERRPPPGSPSSSSACDIIELEAADLLAKYTHYCQICGKGFKRDANLRMHMRAHGDEYKTNAALANPMKSGGGAAHVRSAQPPTRTKYSCPHEGCRWNKNHAKFQPLKSTICVKNHYKRSHCPKMYVCNQCNRKQFSVLSDLRTHEKHCGDIKWLCSCGTTFSRKDKLLGHVALFSGHTPAVDCFAKQGSSTGVQQKGSAGIQMDGSCD